MRLTVATLMFAAIVAFSPVLSLGQQATLSSYGATESHGIENIDLQTLTPSFDIRVIAKTGAIPFSFSESSTSVCVKAGVINYYYWNCGGYLGSTPGSPHMPDNLLGAYATYSYPVVYASCPDGRQTNEWKGWVIHTNDGKEQHALPYNDMVDTLGCISTGFADVTIDGTGLTLSVQNTGTIDGTISDRSGRYVTGVIQINSTSEHDTFGNTISFSSGAYTDTLGNTTISEVGTNSNNLQYTDVNGTSRDITFGFSSVSMSTNFNCPGITDENGSGTVLSSIAYPDGTEY